MPYIVTNHMYTRTTEEYNLFALLNVSFYILQSAFLGKLRLRRPFLFGHAQVGPNTHRNAVLVTRVFSVMLPSL